MWAFELRILLSTLKIQQDRIYMAGELKTAMDKWRRARQKLIDNITAEVNKQIALMPTIEADARTALALPAAELNKTRDEINAIHEEFGQLTNGGPAGPLPDISPAGVPLSQPQKQSNGTPEAVKNVVNELQN